MLSSWKEKKPINSVIHHQTWLNSSFPCPSFLLPPPVSPLSPHCQRPRSLGHMAFGRWKVLNTGSITAMYFRTLECVHNGTGKRTPIPPPPPGHLEVRSSGLTRRANGANCDISNVIADQANVAQGMMGNWLGGGRKIDTYVSNWFTYGDTQAYVCWYSNEGGPITLTSSDYWNDIAAVNSKCGFTHGSTAGGGWYYHPNKEDPARWSGRTLVGNNFC
jgi:hypothetical protein